MRHALRNGRVELAVHARPAQAEGPPLLLLHALFGSSADWDGAAAGWPGPVFALDFCGHGDSQPLPGHAYSPETFAADADAVLAHFADEAPFRVAGAGVGAYAALLLAGARRASVDAVLLLPGAGLAGGASLPSELGPDAESALLDDLDEWRAGLAGSPDPLVRRCARDVRPLYYAEAFADALAQAGRPLLVAGIPSPPPWLAAAMQRAHAKRVSSGPREALASLASVPR